MTVLVSQEVNILLFNHGAESATEVSQIIQNMNLDKTLVFVSLLDDARNTCDNYNIIVLLSGHDDDSCIDLIRELMTQNPEASLIYLPEKDQRSVARHCLHLENGYFLRLDDAGLLPDLIQQILTKQVKTQERIDYLKQQQETIVMLATNPSLKAGDWQEALHEITRMTTETLGVNRVSIWFYNDAKDVITCDLLYSADSQSGEEGMELSAEIYPGYFKALHENRVIVADDAHNNPATCEFSGNYLDANGIASMLDAPIRIQGQMVGVICNEQVGTIRHWTYDDQQFVGAIADLVAQTLENRERRRAEEALRKREGYLKEAEAIAHLGNFEANLTDYSVTCSDEVYRIFGRDREAGITWELYQNLLATEDYERVMSAVGRAIEEDESYEIEHDIQLEDGTIKHLFSIGRPLKDDAGNVTKIFGIVQDITAMKQAEQEHIELELNQQKVAFLQDFIGSMTHDLKTPLSSIISSSYLLKRIVNTDKQIQHLKRVDRQTQHLAKMIDDILMVSNLEYLPELQFHRTNLNDIIHDIVERLQAKIIKKNISLRLELSSQVLEIHASRKELIRALLNLVENALNYTPEDGDVTIKTYRNETHVLCEIIDTGIGIKADDLPRIFDPFYRADNARSFDTGTGLGLAIVKKILDLHHGEITAKSEADSGTTMLVMLKQTP